MITTAKSTRIKKVFIVAIALCLILSTVSACSSGGLKGTYVSQGTIAQTFTFSGSNNVTMSAFGINANGTYEINGSRMSIKYSLFGFSQEWSCSFSQSGNSIYIEGTEFVKQ